MPENILSGGYRFVLCLIAGGIGIWCALLVHRRYSILQNSCLTTEEKCRISFAREAWQMIASRNSRDLEALIDQLKNAYLEHIRQLSESLVSYGQILVTILIVIILAILMLSQVITAEAGLPILSGISGFAIAKGMPALVSTHDKEERSQKPQ